MQKMETLKVGQDITIVSKGIRHSNYDTKTWIDELDAGSTSFLKITKLGNKYVYGVHFYFEDGKRKDYYYESKHDLEEYIVYDGVHTELEKQHRKFRLDCDNYEKLKEEKHRKLDWKLQQQLNAKMEKWLIEHPRPKNPAIT